MLKLAKGLLRRLVMLIVLCFFALGASCASVTNSLVTLMPGVLNDPSNRTLRREILSFGSDQFCKELKKRGAPLRMSDGAPIMGRFFVTQCEYKEQDNGDVFVQFSGFGYGWTQPTRRLGFSATGAVQYNQDFLLDGSTMYAYFRPRGTPITTFKTEMMESREQSGGIGVLMSGMFGMDQTANRIGQQLLSEELKKGFTVIREGNATTDFGLGIVEKGARPFHPFQIHGSDKVQLANERCEIHEQQRDFIGPFEVDENGRAIYVTMILDGTPAVDVFVVKKDAGDAWVNEYVYKPGVTQAWVPLLLTDVLRTGADWRRTAPLQKGLYYLVIDHSSAAGPASPPVTPTGGSDSPAVVSYVVQLGDAP
ncbi:MAG: hypothetical protein U0165_06745 [Polyangiaceae bacterium]